MAEKLFEPSPNEVSTLPEIASAIEASRWILKLEHDWDENGASSYSENTWNTATDFVRRHADTLSRLYGENLDTPQILPGPNASIDVHWKKPRYELLINFPADATQPASFYGDDYGSIAIKGTLNPKASNPGLLIWLKSQN